MHKAVCHCFRYKSVKILRYLRPVHLIFFSLQDHLLTSGNPDHDACANSTPNSERLSTDGD